ncbi:hypothetical protein OB919_14840 [Halobacteria archaeon AArc-curdl1]|uniref:Cbb3-type cytochrome c oxidase subunit I n=1 Tax=Natronosalvus hydrolyticus TaxID=2979988 RepID=A0AAP2ZB06_9EURY|nr:hypothetical protein [Halobacteria archaeon AArc-curdl1]
MSAIPGAIDPEQSPPLTIPLRHFLVGLVFLLLGAGLGALQSLDGGLLPGDGHLAYVHLLLAGWICVTIMGAMTQFVPVWSGVVLHSRRLATAQLWMVSVGLIALVVALLVGAYGWLPLGGLVLLAGFWLFVYNLGRTLLVARPWDITERHFTLALGFFLLLTTLGAALAAGFTRPIFRELPVTQGSVRMAHATLALYGTVLMTIFGALYQLGTMFTQSSLHGIDHWIRRFEATGFPVGVLALAGGRLFELEALAQVGAMLVVLTVLAFSLLLARRLYEAQVPWTPMLSRYVVLTVAMATWALWSLPTWIHRPLAPDTLFGPPGAFSLFVLGIVGFVVLGTLYHIIPFIIWVHRYSDRLGLEDVPMIDDLYDERIAVADLVCFTAGLAFLVGADGFAVPGPVSVLGSVLVTAGVVLFGTNMLLVIRRHSPHSLPGIVSERFRTTERVSGDSGSTRS